MSSSPPDHCPHASGRAGGFGQCPAFDPVIERPPMLSMPGVDFLTREPAPLMTCTHLTIGSAQEGSFYPRCALGTRAARVRCALGARSA